MAPQSATQDDIVFIQVGCSLVQVLELGWMCSTDGADQSVSLSGVRS